MTQSAVVEVQLDERRPVNEIQKNNIRNILLNLKKEKILSRKDLCEKCGLTGAGLSRNIHKLIDAGLVIEELDPVISGRLGRRRSFLTINPNGVYVFCVTIAHNRKSVALMNAAGIVIVERELTELDLSNPFATLSTIAQNLESLVTKYNLTLEYRSIMLGISDGSVVIKGNEVTSQC